MRGQIARITLLAFQVVWLNAVLPGHTRGIVPMNCDAAQSRSTCAMSVAGKACSKKAAEPDAPTPPGRSSNCAVCQHAARITPPPTVDWDLAPLELVELALELTPPAAESAETLWSYDGRAPPIA